MVIDVPQLDLNDTVPQNIKNKITAIWRKGSELECLANETGYQNLMNHFNLNEREHVLLENMMIQMLKKQQTFLNELMKSTMIKKQVKKLKKQLKLKVLENL